ncbi:MAG: MFS transporter [Planctomycetota bacterium]|nr:MFS transporter [Planctomycetota bacterium]
MSDNAAPATSPASKPDGFGFIYWVANWMELVERFAYYGVRMVLPVLMVKAIEHGGPEFDHIQKGTIYAVWALVQSFVPIFTGGFADRFGYKVNIAAATVLKILGYLLMGYCIFIAEWMAGVPLREARDAGSDLTFELFFVGSMLLATGTAVFKPGLQGLIAHQMPKGKEAVGWAMFYAMVNVGGFFGPLVAGYMEVMPWHVVFLINTGAITLNFIPLFIFKEPEHEGDQNESALMVLNKAFRGLLEPRLFFFTIAFAGFWLMFYQLFDILPNFIDDWVDSRAAADMLIGALGESAVPTVNGGNLTQAWMINFNALIIIFFAFFVGTLTGKIKSLNAIILGIGVSAVAIFAFSLSASGWWTLAAIGIFSIGEMTASPTKMRYLASIAPPGKEGLYMGYVNFTVGIGWSVGSIIAGILYQSGGDKTVLAKRYLVEERPWLQQRLEGMQKADVLPFFEETVGVDPWQTRDMLWNLYAPQTMWNYFALIGIASMIGIFFYNKTVTSAKGNPNHGFNLKGHNYVSMALAPIAAAFWWGTYKLNADGREIMEMLAVIVQAVIFSCLFVLSLTMGPPETPVDNGREE